MDELDGELEERTDELNEWTDEMDGQVAQVGRTR
jgi:hypothetical protein